MDQLQKFKHLLAAVWKQNAFYSTKWKNAGLSQTKLRSLEEIATFPLTTREELIADQKTQPPLGTNLSWPLERYTRLHCSEGTIGTPIFWADDAESWRTIIACSGTLFRWSGVGPQERVYVASAFAASSGPWLTLEGGAQRGCLCFTSKPVPADQLRAIQDFHATVLIGKPDELAALTDAANNAKIPPQSLGVRKLILHGAPGGHVPETRQQLEQAWNAEVFDRYASTEAGAIAGECPTHPGGLHLLDNELIGEVIDPETAKLLADGAEGELVLTHLSRLGQPLIRYRTGDIVRLLRNHRCVCGNRGPLLMGGVRRRE
jgi:phenylacetate-CoA ligase